MKLSLILYDVIHQWHTQEFCSGGGVQQILLRTEDRENGDLGVVAPKSGVLEAAVIFVLQNFRGSLNPPNPPQYATVIHRRK